MSYLDNASLVNKIKVFTILSNKPSNDLFNPNSNLSSRDPIKLLLDLLGLILGTGFIKVLLAKLITSFIRELEPLIKKELKKNNISNSSNQPTFGFTIPVLMSLLDFNDLFKIDPNTVEGRNLMPNGSFEYNFYSNVLNGNNNANYFANQTNVTYSSVNNLAMVSNNNIQNLTRQGQLDIMVESIPLLNIDLIVSLVIDGIYGNLSKKKSINGIKNDLLLDNLINDIIENNSEVEEFVLTVEKLQKLEDDSNKIKKGINVLDFGCGDANLTLPNNFLDDNKDEELVIKLDLALTKPLANANIDSNEAIVNNYYNNVIKTLLLVLIKSLLFSPQMIIFLLVQNRLAHGKNNSVNIIEFFNNNKGLIRYLICFIKNRFVQYIFDFFKKELIKLIIPVLKLILREKITAYKKTLSSLIIKK